MSDSHSLGDYNRALCKCKQPKVARFTGLGLLKEGIPEEGCERPSPKSLGVSLQSRREGEALGPHPHPLTQPPEDFLSEQESPPSLQENMVGTVDIWSLYLTHTLMNWVACVLSTWAGLVGKPESTLPTLSTLAITGKIS